MEIHCGICGAKSINGLCPNCNKTNSGIGNDASSIMARDITQIRKDIGIIRSCVIFFVVIISIAIVVGLFFQLLGTV